MHIKGSHTGVGGLKIRRQPVDFPVAIAGRLGAAAAADFLRLLAGLPVAFGAARRRLGKRAFRGRRERTFFRNLAAGALGGRALGRVLL